MTVDQVIDTLLELGFAPAGETREEIVRIPTRRSPVYGGLGGERRAFGGRARYVLLGTDLRATVGPRTVNVYYARGEGEVEFVMNARTKELTTADLRAAVCAASPTS